MQAFWGKLSEVELTRQTKVKEAEATPQQEIVQIEATKPKIKPRMKFSKPSKFISQNEDNAKKIKAEIEKLYVKPEATAVSVKAIEESRLDEISNITYDSSPSPELEKKSDQDTKSDSESSMIQVAQKKTFEVKPSTFKSEKRSVTR